MQEPQNEITIPATGDETRRRIISVLADVRENIGDGPDMVWTMHERMADALIADGLVKTKPKTKPKTKQADRPAPKNNAATILDAVGQWAGGAVLILIAAAALIGPGLYDEIMEDRTLSVLDLSDPQIRETSLADLTDLRGNVESYAKDKDADPAIAGKAASILDTAIDERINGR